MGEVFSAPENMAFSVSLAVMLILALIEGVGMLLGAGLSSFIDGLLPDVDIDVDAPDMSTPGMMSQFLGWLFVGKVPFLVILILFLTSFGVSGLILQSVALGLMGFMFPALLAVPTAIAIALPSTRISAALMARVLPKDETEAVSGDSFVGRVATITTGHARPGYPAQARLSDQYGQSHYVMVEPTEGQLEQGSEVLLIKKKGNVFLVIENTNINLVDHE